MITDANDNRPVFEQNRYQLELLERRPVGFELYAVQATDNDWGRNADVRYKIVGATPINAKNLFDIEPRTGVIKIVQEIKRQDFSKIILEVKATDNGLPPLSSKCEVEIKIVIGNYHNPKISLTPIYPDVQNPEIAVINENAPIGTYVVWVKVTDEDFNANGDIYVSLQPDEIFEMILDHGAIVSRKQFDRETKDSYELTLTACDRGTPKRCSSATMMVKVGDENDDKTIESEKISLKTIIESSYIFVRNNIIFRFLSEIFLTSQP